MLFGKGIKAEGYIRRIILHPCVCLASVIIVHIQANLVSKSFAVSKVSQDDIHGSYTVI